MSIKIPSSQKASDFQHENHYPPSGPFTFLAWAGVSLVAPHLHLPLPAGPRPPARRWGSPAAAAFQVSPGNNSGGALQGNNSCIIYATSCFWEVDFFQMGNMMQFGWVCMWWGQLCCFHGAPDPSVPETNLQLHLIPGTFLLLCLFFFFPRKVFPQITSWG